MRHNLLLDLEFLMSAEKVEQKYTYTYRRKFGSTKSDTS